MIDLHSHILPGMDDGSPDAETSMQMLRQMAVQGVTSVCASSHYYADENSVNQFCTRRQAAWAQLQAAGLGQHADQPTVLLAAEVAYFPCISECKDLPQLCIEGTRTLLLEMPFCEWNDFQVEEVTALTLDLGYQLVLVHPERFLFSKNNRRRLERLMELPIGLQVNAGSLLHWQTRNGAAHSAGNRLPAARQRRPQPDDPAAQYKGGTKRDRTQTRRCLLATNAAKCRPDARSRFR